VRRQQHRDTNRDRPAASNRTRVQKSGASAFKTVSEEINPEDDESMSFLEVDVNRDSVPAVQQMLPNPLHDQADQFAELNSQAVAHAAAPADTRHLESRVFQFPDGSKLLSSGVFLQTDGSAASGSAASGSAAVGSGSGLAEAEVRSRNSGMPEPGELAEKERQMRFLFD